MRLSDILKKRISQSAKEELRKSEPSKELEQAAQSAPPVQFTKAMSGKAQLPEVAAEAQHEMRFVKAMKEVAVTKEDLENIYNNGIELSKETLSRVRRSAAIDPKLVKDWVGKLVDLCVLGKKELEGHFYEQDNECYLYRHMVNVSIMSVELALESGYNKSKLNELGVAAFLYDIGMVNVENIILQPRALSKREYLQVKEHINIGSAILLQLKDLPESVAVAARQHHERANGKGYPSGLKGNEAAEFSRIIGIVDVYEALTHRRAHRREYSPHEAVKVILTELCDSFGQSVMKTLVNHVGIYPIGSWVELNTDETGRVLASSNEFPLRPVIKLFFDNSGKRLSEPKVINLSKQSNVFIRRPVCDKDISCNL